MANLFDKFGVNETGEKTYTGADITNMVSHPASDKVVIVTFSDDHKALLSKKHPVSEDTVLYPWRAANGAPWVSTTKGNGGLSV